MRDVNGLDENSGRDENLYRCKRIVPSMRVVVIIATSLAFMLTICHAQQKELTNYNIRWTTQSKNSGESMPCGGGDIGLNVWAENGDLLFYFSQSGTFDENNALLKLGRVRIRLTPNPLSGKNFKQELMLNDGYVSIRDAGGSHTIQINVWVDVFRPVIHVDINSNKPVTTEASYENWRYEDRHLHGRENNANSYKWAKMDVITFHDYVSFDGNDILFYHRNREKTIFDLTVEQQGLDSVKGEMFNPLKNLTFGGMMRGSNMKPSGTDSGSYVNTPFKSWKLTSVTPSRSHALTIYLNADQTNDLSTWKAGLQKTIQNADASRKNAFTNSKKWWNEYWKRSYIFIQPDSKDVSSPEWQAGRNYQLFRYMLGCNAYGKYPTKFNGGLFTYDPVFTDSTMTFSPDHRNWGGGTMTAQNQRLVYYPMLKSGDIDMMKAQFDFYLSALHNAELRSEVYWHHGGACFTEQLENFGLPNCSEYGWDRPPELDKGVQYNAWLEYEWETVLEFCQMILETNRYAGKDISKYLPLIESCLNFFDEHYQYLARTRGIKPLDADGHLILYPGSGGETYKMAYNSTSTIAALKTVLTELLALPEQYLNGEQRKKWSEMADRIPPLTFREFDGHKTIAPAKVWARINNTEPTQLYPVFPWGMYGVGRPDLETAINTFRYDSDAVKFRSHIGWKQDNIFAARLGLTEEAADLTVAKLKDSGRRFPAFWGPGFDWVPDHNWGGSGMIGLQEMLLQTNGDKIYLFPAWPSSWDVHFKLHAPGNTVVECLYSDGKVQQLSVYPETRKKDVIVLLK